MASERLGRGFDGNKKVKGIKRSIIVDRNGYILSRKVSSAGLHDVHSVRPLCEDASSEWEGLNKILVDRGYRGEIADDIRRDFNIDIEVSNTPDGVKGFTPKHLRWVVDRTFSWLDRFRRLARNYEQLPESSEEMIDFAAIKI